MDDLFISLLIAKQEGALFASFDLELLVGRARAFSSGYLIVCYDYGPMRETQSATFGYVASSLCSL